ncbi:MAG: twin-arginine translocation signal domain-containing protein, partial [Oscillibacter sp.]|nr:twin-arginine translocation signal domain-containing protein [Oscillibacter sp.]
MESGSVLLPKETEGGNTMAENISRRTFVKGLAAGAAALGLAGLAGCAAAENTGGA